VSARGRVRRAVLRAAACGSGGRISVAGWVCSVQVRPLPLLSRAGLARVVLLARLWALPPVC
jgi:hypothetical protein